MCKGLHSDTLNLECLYRGGKVDCGQPVKPGTELKTGCKPTYHISDPSTTFTVTQCLSDGTWANELYTCVPGKPQPPANSIVYNIYNLYIVNLPSSDKLFSIEDFLKYYYNKNRDFVINNVE